MSRLDVLEKIAEKAKKLCDRIDWLEDRGANFNKLEDELIDLTSYLIELEEGS